MTDQQLSEHFWLSEFTTSQTASRRGLDNTPPPEVLARLEDTAERLETVRDVLGKPIHVNSGYRSPEVNKAVGGAPTSAHVLGYAVDFICPQHGTPLDICRTLVGRRVQFDQLIEEGTWVHISWDPRMRGQVLTKAAGGGYTQGLRR